MIELADTSAWFVSRRSEEVRRRFDRSTHSGEIGTCDAVKLELLFTARSGDEFSARRAELGDLPQFRIGPREFERALDVYEELAHQGGLHHRRSSTRIS